MTILNPFSTENLQKCESLASYYTKQLLHDNKNLHFWRIPLGFSLFPESCINPTPFNQFYIHDLKTWCFFESAHEYYENKFWCNFTTPLCFYSDTSYKVLNESVKEFSKELSSLLPKDKELWLGSYGFGFESIIDNDGLKLSMDYYLFRRNW